MMAHSDPASERVQNNRRLRSASVRYRTKQSAPIVLHVLLAGARHAIIFAAPRIALAWSRRDGGYEQSRVRYEDRCCDHVRVIQ